MIYDVSSTQTMETFKEAFEGKGVSLIQKMEVNTLLLHALRDAKLLRDNHMEELKNISISAERV